MMSRTSFPYSQPMRPSSMGHAIESPDPRPIPLRALVRQGPWRLTQSDGLVVLHGHPTVLRLGLCAAVDRGLAGEPVLYVDGANSFNPFAIGWLARDAGSLPRTILSSIRVSRASTCHQMVQLVTERLGPALRAARGSSVILSGPLEPFYDETVPAAEAVRLAQVLFASLRLLTGQGGRVLVGSVSNDQSDLALRLGRCSQKEQQQGERKHGKDAVHVDPPGVFFLSDRLETARGPKACASGPLCAVLA